MYSGSDVDDDNGYGEYVDDDDVDDDPSVKKLKGLILV